MAVIDPTVSRLGDSAVVTWAGVSTADTMTGYNISGGGPARMSVQLSSVAWGGSTVVLQGSNNNTTFVTVKDLNSTAVSATANAWFEVETCAAYIKPASSGGTADNVDVIIAFKVK